MRRITLGSTGIETSCLGFGCASLGSRVAEAPGAAALAAAFDRGVTWFDLAPIYGAGQAEEIAGRFVRGRRDAVQICTKVGLAPVGGNGGGGNGGGGLKARAKAALMPVARRAVQAVPALRKALRRGPGGFEALPLTPELLRGSLEESLTRLGTDYVDLYALHDAAPAALADEAVIETLQDLLRAGKARAVAIASDAAAALAAVAHGPPFGAVQLALPAPGAADTVLPRARAAGLGALTHSVFGIDGSLEALRARVRSEPALRARLEEAAPGAGGTEGALSRLLLGRAFALNPDGVVLVSMFSERSRAANLPLAAAPPPEGPPALDALLGAKPAA